MDQGVAYREAKRVLLPVRGGGDPTNHGGLALFVLILVHFIEESGDH